MSGIGHYEMNYEVDRYSFLKKEKIGNMNVYRSKFTLDWNEISDEYMSVGIGNVAHFASQYVFAKALISGRTSEREEMQTMYLDIVHGVNRLIENGDLPKSI